MQLEGKDNHVYIVAFFRDIYLKHFVLSANMQCYMARLLLSRYLCGGGEGHTGGAKLALGFVPLVNLLLQHIAEWT